MLGDVEYIVAIMGVGRVAKLRDTICRLVIGALTTRYLANKTKVTMRTF